MPDISSTMVRALVRDALPTHNVLTPAVESYVYRNGLYFPPGIRLIQEKVCAILGKKSYAHTMDVVQMAVRLAPSCGIKGPQMRLAALLHSFKESWPEVVGFAAGDKENTPKRNAANLNAFISGLDFDEFNKLIYLAGKFKSQGGVPSC